jgi:hypothetical protein
MGFFEMIFGKVDPLAVVAFVVVTLGITYFLKKAIVGRPRLCYYLDDDFPKVVLSWFVGAGVFMAMHFTLHDFPITELTVLQFAIWVLLLNGGYKVISTVRDYIREWKNKP